MSSVFGFSVFGFRKGVDVLGFARFSLGFDKGVDVLGFVCSDQMMI